MKKEPIVPLFYKVAVITTALSVIWLLGMVYILVKG